MLVLSRKINEALMINDNIEIKIIDINGDKVKIGITAPLDYKVLRSELCNTIDANREAAGSKINIELMKLIKDRNSTI